MEIKGRSLVGIAWLRLGVSSVCSAEFNSVWRVTNISIHLKGQDRSTSRTV